MNKTAIKNFAVWARRKLISEITYKAGLIGISEGGKLSPLPISTDNIEFYDIGTVKPTELTGIEVKQRKALVKKIEEKESTSDYKTAFQFVVEEVAYTWFNRLVAIRFMEANDYLSSHVRVLSSEMSGKAEPDMVTTPFDTDMEFSSYEIDRIVQLKDENKLDELFRMLFIKQCNKLNEVLPELFERTNDYTEFLLNISFTDNDGIVSHLVNDIAEDNFKEAVEIIGWLYQYYNTELNEVVYDGTMSKSKISKELLPAATTMYTPDWAIRYMVENSVGKLWLEGHSNDDLKTGWKYYLDEVEQEESVKTEFEKIRAEYKKITPKDIKIIDPCMGSGHILVYAFNVLMQIYESQGYTQRDAVKEIVEKNLYGLDIDDRAYQLAYFAVMMKARQYDRRFLSRGVTPKLHSIKESNRINKSHILYFGKALSEIERTTAINQIGYLLSIYDDAKEYGSILNIDECDWGLLHNFVDDYSVDGQITLDSIGAEETQKQLKTLLSTAQTMAQKYSVVVTNPPYLGSSRFSPKLDKYVKDNYTDVKSDLSMVMFKHAIDTMCRKNGFVSFITTSSWMFLSSFEKLRKHILNGYCFDSIADFGTELFDGKVGHNPIVAWVNRKAALNIKMTGIRLVDYCYSRRDEKEPEFFNNRNHYITTQENFSRIPGSPIAYWVSDVVFNTYTTYPPLGEIAAPRKGNSTSDNNRFLRLWFEVNNNKMNMKCKELTRECTLEKKWFPYNKGGGYRKWYGFNEYLINWYDDAATIRSIKTSVIANYQYFMRPGLTWSTLTSGNFSIRWFDEGFIFDNGGCCIFELGEKRPFIAALLNSNVFKYIFRQLNPTLNFQSGEVSKFPIAYSQNQIIDTLAVANVNISKLEYDSFETSWDFITHPLITYKSGAGYSDVPMVQWQYRIADAFKSWESNAEEQFNTLKSNEEELNLIFIDIYGLQDELTPEVADKDVTVRKADLTRDIKSFVSYAVGCMFGRYSLDVGGLAYAGGDWDNDKYSTFIPDADNCIPITDEEYFEDDIVGLFVAFVKKVYGAVTLEENLDFIAKALGNKGNTSREIIRNYFVKDFYKDHVKTYQKRPIYWLYDSGKQDSFKALVYMHRYNADTTGLVRVDYLHKMQKTYMSEIDRMQDEIENGKTSDDISKAEKRKEKLVKQLKETKEYDEKIAHLALSRISIDLDDGVKVNYEKVQTGQDRKKLDTLGKI